MNEMAAVSKVGYRPEKSASAASVHFHRRGGRCPPLAAQLLHIYLDNYHPLLCNKLCTTLELR